MKKLSVLLIGLISIISVNAFCQPANQKNKGAHYKEMNEKMKTELNLSENQEKQWDEIHEKYRESFMEMKKEEKGEREVKREKMKSMKEGLDKEVLEILNEQQQQDYNKLVEENRNQMKGMQHKKMKGGKMGASFIQLKEDLDLSNDQEKQWDGMYNGLELPMCSYVYIVNLKNDKDPYTGTVTIVR